MAQRTFVDNGREVVFSHIQFREEMRRFKSERIKKGEKCSLDSIFDELAETVHKSPDAVKNWYKGANGTDDLETIKEIAMFLNIDYRDLLKTKSVENLTEGAGPMLIASSQSKEKDVLLEMYDMFVEFIYLFFGVDEKCYADNLYENVEEVRDEYVYKMYKYLDKSAFFITEETYSKLRRIITEISLGRIINRERYCMLRWSEINPRLRRGSFECLADGDFSVEVDNYTNCIDEEDCEDDYEELMHMYLEDYEGYWSKVLSNENYDTMPGSDKLEGFACCPIYQLIPREVALTLKMVYKHDFPKYFGSDNQEG